MRHETTYQRFRRLNEPKVLDMMSRCGVTCNRSTIFELLMRDLWVAEAAKKSLMHFDRESWISRQLSTPSSKNT